jgi:hypothetical protein
MEDCETNDCRKEKRGCKGCYYDKNIDEDIRITKGLYNERHFWLKNSLNLKANIGYPIEKIEKENQSLKNVIDLLDRYIELYGIIEE